MQLQRGKAIPSLSPPTQKDCPPDEEMHENKETQEDENMQENKKTVPFHFHLSSQSDSDTNPDDGSPRCPLIHQSPRKHLSSEVKDACSVTVAVATTDSSLHAPAPAPQNPQNPPNQILINGSPRRSPSFLRSERCMLSYCCSCYNRFIIACTCTCTSESSKSSKSSKSYSSSL